MTLMSTYANVVVMTDEELTALVPFVSQAGTVRTATIDNEPWLMLSDLCKILEITNPARAAKRLDPDEYTETKVSTGSGPKTALVVNEPGFYHLVMTSRSAAADALRRWISHDVLPSIREHGAYLTEKLTAESTRILDTHDQRMDATAYEVDRAYRQCEKCPTCRPDYLVFAAEHLRAAREAETPVNGLIRRSGTLITMANPDQIRSPAIRAALGAPTLAEVRRQQAAAYSDGEVDNI